jgi:hypothetical protein
MPDPGYGFLDRFLHRLALEFRSIAEMSFDLDQRIVRTDPAEIISNRHVFVAGLARAGTTVLMRRFHETGLYQSLTYRNMPFVLAPNLWQRLSAVSKREIQSVERAHGDNIFVDVDSPESFEEVFWRIFSGDEYLQTGKLIPHEPDEDVIETFIRYVNAILSTTHPRGERYLSKNNNNILRLDAIRQAFPNALILIPFREPLQQAQSLLRQHRRFIELQENDSFTLSYMTWLGHHEFGLDHRPFEFGGAASNPYPATTFNYWLHLWCETYGWLENAISTPAIFVCYEDLCADKEYWTQVARLAEISTELNTADPFELNRSPLDTGIDPPLAERASAIYDRLVLKARTI